MFGADLTAFGGLRAHSTRLHNEERRKLVNPTGGKVHGRDPQGCGRYGARRVSQDGQRRLHTGSDYVGTPGQDVLAVTDGTVNRIGKPYRFYEDFRLVEIKTSEGHIIRQMYVAPAPGVVQGVTVSAGQVIGTLQNLQTVHPGITNHVHVDIKYKGKFLDPTNLIPRE